MDTMQQQHDGKGANLAAIIATVEREGRVTSRFHELTLSADSPEIRVRDLRTGQLVAFSSTRADFGQSLEEFVADYIV